MISDKHSAWDTILTETLSSTHPSTNLITRDTGEPLCLLPGNRHTQPLAKQEAPKLCVQGSHGFNTTAGLSAGRMMELGAQSPALPGGQAAQRPRLAFPVSSVGLSHLISTSSGSGRTPLFLGDSKDIVCLPGTRDKDQSSSALHNNIKPRDPGGAPVPWRSGCP